MKFTSSFQTITSSFVRTCSVFRGLQMSIPTKEQVFVFFVPLSRPSWKSFSRVAFIKPRFKPYAVAKETQSVPCLCCLGFKGEAQFTASLNFCLPVAGNSIRLVCRKQKKALLGSECRPGHITAGLQGDEVVWMYFAVLFVIFI